MITNKDKIGSTLFNHKKIINEGVCSLVELQNKNFLDQT